MPRLLEGDNFDRQKKRSVKSFMRGAEMHPGYAHMPLFLHRWKTPTENGRSVANRTMSWSEAYLPLHFLRAPSLPCLPKSLKAVFKATAST
jgi:hypothetical protein